MSITEVQGTSTLAASALQRYLGEAAWFPTVLLPSQGVAWSAIDDTRARATIKAGATAISLECRFGAEGLIAAGFAAERIYDDGKIPPRLVPWQARILRHRQREGLRVPADAVAEWLFPEGAYAYWRGRPVQIDYTLSRFAARVPGG